MNDVVFCINKNFLQHFTVSLVSLATNNKVRIHLISNNLENDDKKYLEGICRNVGSEIHFYEFNLKMPDLPVNDHFSIESYYRLYVDDFLPDSIKKLLYIDADTVIIKEIQEIFDINIENHMIVAVEDPAYDKLSTKNYFNSGVMLINMEKWRKENVKEKVLDYITNNPDKIKYVDQCGLNAIIGNDWLPIHPKYNQQTVFFDSNVKHKTFNDASLYEARKRPSIIHYTSTPKPWHYICTRPYKSEYFNYLKKTKYKKYKCNDISIYNYFKKIRVRKLLIILRRYINI